MQSDAALNDNTHKFTLQKKNIQQEMLFSLNFVPDVSNSLKDFENDIKGQKQQMQWEDSVYRKRLIDKFKIVIKKKKGEGKDSTAIGGNSAADKDNRNRDSQL